MLRAVYLRGKGMRGTHIAERLWISERTLRYWLSDIPAFRVRYEEAYQLWRKGDKEQLAEILKDTKQLVESATGEGIVDDSFPGYRAVAQLSRLLDPPRRVRNYRKMPLRQITLSSKGEENSFPRTEDLHPDPLQDQAG